MSSTLRVGMRVTAAVGPMVEDPKAKEKKSGQRKHRQRWNGTIIKSAGGGPGKKHCWIVYWDQTMKCSKIVSSSMKSLKKMTTDPNLLNPENVEVLIQKCMVDGTIQNYVDGHSFTMRFNKKTTLDHPAPAPPVKTNHAPAPDATAAATEQPTVENADDEEDEEEELLEDPTVLSPEEFEQYIQDEIEKLGEETYCKAVSYYTLNIS